MYNIGEDIIKAIMPQRQPSSRIDDFKFFAKRTIFIWVVGIYATVAERNPHNLIKRDTCLESGCTGLQKFFLWTDVLLALSIVFFTGYGYYAAIRTLIDEWRDRSKYQDCGTQTSETDSQVGKVGEDVGRRLDELFVVEMESH